MPVTLRFQSTGAVPGDGAPIVMIGPSLTIGRGPENDVVLPDPDRLISKNHCAIEDQAGDVVVIDFSTNGTFLNYGKNALGRVPTPLNDGDVLSMGGYELIVAIASTGPSKNPMANLPPPVDDTPVSHGQAGSSPENLLDLLEDHGSKKVDFLDDLMGEQAPRGPSQIVREDPIDSLMLPQVGNGEDDILGRIPDPLDEDTGPSMGESSGLSDAFRPSRHAAPVIPDDWDDDLLSPTTPEVLPTPEPVAEPQAKAPVPPPAEPAAVKAPAEQPAEAPTLEPAAPPRPAPEAPALHDPSRSHVPPPPPLPARAKPPKQAEPPVGDDRSPFAAPAQAGRVSTSVVPPPPPLQRNAPARAPAAPAITTPSATTDAARAFLRGAGAEDVTISDEELTETMERLGGVMATLITGLREILMTRSSIKSEFKIDQTRIGAGGNNPLKFSLSPEHAIEMLLKPKARGYLEAGPAVEEALRDIKAHEVAMVTGMQAAIKDVLARLDPALLEKKIGGGSGIADLIKGRKSRYWETYEKLFAEISEQAEQDFHEFFSKEFANAYKKQLERLK